MADISQITLLNGQTYNVKDASARVTATTATIAATGWSNNKKTITVNGVTSSNHVVVTYAPASKAVWTAADIYCSAQGSNSLTFTCSTVPTASVTANILIIP